MVRGKRWVGAGIREILKMGSSLASALTRSPPREVVILMYHRVSGTLPLELDLPFPVFRAQMEALASSGSVVSIDAAITSLTDPSGRVGQGPGVVLTFDDAYEDFFTRAFPLLSDLGLPATLYVPSGFVDRPDRVPVSIGDLDPSLLPPCSWDMLGRIQESPLMTLGSHTHTHRELPGLTDSEIEWELETALNRFQAELGSRPTHFAYPRGAWDDRSEQVAVRYHRHLAVIEGHALDRRSFLPERLPRIPVHRSDGLRWFGPKLRGRLDREEWLKTRLKPERRTQGIPA